MKRIFEKTTIKDGRHQCDLCQTMDDVVPEPADYKTIKECTEFWGMDFSPARRVYLCKSCKKYITSVSRSFHS